jgi:glycosyltransferase involved in cell wall biosynthesis
LKIGFPISPEGRGGTRTWLRAFSNYCVSKGHQVFFNHDEKVDVFITLAYYSPPNKLLELKARSTKIIYRMDGIYFNYLVGSKEATKQYNDLLANSMKCADKIIYQSEFAKVMAKELFDGQELPGVVIYNGADTKKFKNEGDILDRPIDKKIILSIAYWGTPLMAEYSINHIIKIAQQFKDMNNMEFWILGEAYPHVEELIKKVNLSNITRFDLKNPITRENMPKYIRTSDLVLHTRPNDACSNLIIEAMNVGKPIVGLNLGSTPELLGDAGLRGECKPSFKHFPDININSMVEQIKKTFDNYDYYCKKIKQRGSMFTLEKMCEKYMKEIEMLVMR